jgi:hypothetical protein
MNKHLSPLLFCILLAALISSCGSGNNGKEKSMAGGADCANPDDVNPNGSSELALLMRDMTSFSEQMRGAVLHDSLPAFPAGFRRIHAATPTDPEVRGDVFDGHADLYLSALKKLYDEPVTSRIDNYNNLISTCVSCHENFCRGPIKRINKMRINS